MIRRRTWRRALARQWFDGTSIVLLALLHRMRPVEVEAAIRRVVRVKR